MAKHLVALAVVLIVAGCTGTKLEEAKEASPNTDEHGQQLYEGYLRLSESEYSQGDYEDSDHFAELAVRAGSGEKFEPQQINARDLPADSLNDAAAARRQLIVALHNGAAQEFPREAAQAPIVSVIGNTDQSGDENYNFDLAGRRAAAVAEVLAANDVEVAGVYNRGDAIPKLDTLDESPQRVNRRVIIIVREDQG